MLTRVTCCLLALTTLCLSGCVDRNGRKTTDTRKYTIQEVRSVRLPKVHWVYPSPSGEFVAVVNFEQTLIYHLRGGQCIGPDKLDEGGIVRTLMGYPNPFPRWVKGDDGLEVLVLDIHEKRGIRLSNGAWVETTMSEVDFKKPDFPEEHVHCKNQSAGSPCLLKPLLEARERREKPWESMDYPLDIELQLERVTSDGRPYVERRDQIEVEYMIAAHPELDRALAYIDERDRLICANLDTGVARELEVVGHPGMHGSYVAAQYAPDGKWILGCFNYGPDDHYGGGFLQLFTAEGDFVEELASFPGDYGAPAGQGFWLANDWIVYADRVSMHFLKYDSTN